MGKVLFWIIWITELLGFLFLGGCFFLLIGYNNGSGGASMEVLIWALIAATAIVCVYALVKAVTGLRQGVEPAKLAILLAIPPLAVFVCFGSCAFLANL